MLVSCGGKGSTVDAGPVPANGKPFVAGTQPGAPWPAFRHDGGFTALSTARGPTSAKLRWKVDTGAPITTSSPVVGADGTIYIGNVRGDLTAITLAGSIRWQTRLGPIEGTAAIAADGGLFVASNDARIYVVDASTGSARPIYLGEASIQSSMLVDNDGDVYFDGWVLRSGSSQRELLGFAAIAAGHLFLTGSRSSAVLDRLDSQPIDVRRAVPVAVGTPEIVGSDGTSYVLEGTRLVVHDLNGVWKWACELNALPQALGPTPAHASGLLPDGRLVVLTTALLPGLLELAGPTGVAWSVPVPYAVPGALAVDSASTVYFGGADGSLHAFTIGGEPLFTFATGGPIDSSPALGADGTLYVGSTDGFVYALSP